MLILYNYPTWDYHASIIEYLGYDVFELTGLRDPYCNESNGVAFFVDDSTEQIGQRIREKRLELKLTVRGFARKIGVDVKTLRDWERGKHRPLKNMTDRIRSFLAEA
jgi:DNA-binding XRE family transcriptional regulator